MRSKGNGETDCLPEIQSWNGPKQDVGHVELGYRRTISLRVSEKIRLSLSGLENWNEGDRKISTTFSRRRTSTRLTASDHEVDVEAEDEYDGDHVPSPDSVDSGAQENEPGE